MQRRPIDSAGDSETASIELTDEERRLLQACVGFHAKTLTDPSVRGRLYELWCRLNVPPVHTAGACGSQ